MVSYIVFGAFLTAEIQSPYLLVPLSTKILTAIHIVGSVLAVSSIFVARYLGGGQISALQTIDMFLNLIQVIVTLWSPFSLIYLIIHWAMYHALCRPILFFLNTISIFNYSVWWIVFFESPVSIRIFNLFRSFIIYILFSITF